MYHWLLYFESQGAYLWSKVKVILSVVRNWVKNETFFDARARSRGAQLFDVLPTAECNA